MDVRVQVQYEFIYRHKVCYTLSMMYRFFEYLAVDIMISENIPANYEEIWVVARNLPTQKMGNGYFLYAYITGYFISVRHLL